jgi:hypothetical protein
MPKHLKNLPYIYLVLLFVCCANKPIEQKNEDTITPKENTIEAIQAHSTELFLNGFELMYDCYNCSPSYHDSVIVYAKKDYAIYELFRYVLGDYYFGGITQIKHDGKAFILTTLNHTYGHTEGYLYHIDTTTFKTNPIELTQSNMVVIPDSLELWKDFGLQLDDSVLWSGASYRSKENRDKYYLTITYELQKISNANYRLIIKNEKLVKEE